MRKTLAVLATVAAVGAAVVTVPFFCWVPGSAAGNVGATSGKADVVCPTLPAAGTAGTACTTLSAAGKNATVCTTVLAAGASFE